MSEEVQKLKKRYDKLFPKKIVARYQRTPTLLAYEDWLELHDLKDTDINQAGYRAYTAAFDVEEKVEEETEETKQ